MMDVVSLGEALVDFLPNRRGQLVREVTQWTPCLGGAPANVAVGVCRLGAKSGLVGVTGEDEFGHFLKQGLAKEGVDVRHLRQTAEGKTGLGFVSLTKSGERSFTFYRTRAAETFLDQRDTAGARKYLRATKVLHVGTNSLIHAAARAAVRSRIWSPIATPARNGSALPASRKTPNGKFWIGKSAPLLSALMTQLVSWGWWVSLSGVMLEILGGLSAQRACCAAPAVHVNPCRLQTQCSG